MSDETTAVVLEATTGTTETPAAAPEAQTFSADYVKALRSENADWRRQLRETQATLKGLQEGAANAQELTAKITALEAQMAEAAAKVEKAERKATLTRLAADAGITDPDVLELVYSTSIDVSDEAKAKAMFAKLGAGRPTTAQAKPGTVGSTGKTEEELRAELFGGGVRKTTIWGG